MKRLADKTKEELILIKSNYIKKHISNNNRPIGLGYSRTLSNLNRLIIAKG